jgi:hypothetical protein
MTAPAPVPRFAPMPLTSDDDLRSLSIEDVARLAWRSPSRIRDIISKYQLRRRVGWKVYRRRRRRVTTLDTDVARWIIEITLYGRPPVDPPR